MVTSTITLTETGHTVACLIRPYFKSLDVPFASCNVLHPQSTELVVKIDHDNPSGTLDRILSDALLDVERLGAAVHVFMTGHAQHTPHSLAEE